MKKLLAAFILLLASALPALAQCPPNPPPTTATNKAAIIANITSCFADNTTGAITPAITRGMLTQMVNSWAQYGAVNRQTGAAYTVVTADQGQLVTFAAGSGVPTVAVTIPAASSAGFSPFGVVLCNYGNGAGNLGTVVITPTSGLINNGASLALTFGDCIYAVSDGTNWQLALFTNILQASIVWTPTLTFGGGSTGITYSSRSGVWYRHGPLVHISFNFVLTSKGSSTGTAAVQPIPWASLSSAGTGVCGVYYQNMFTGISNVAAFISAGTNAVTFYNANNPITMGVFQDTGFTNTSQIYAACTYFSN
jgi:hypothetical protein